MKSANFLPKLFRWLFTICEVVVVVATVCVAVLMIADPSLPADAHFGPVTVTILGQPGSVVLQPHAGDTSLGVTAFNGGMTFTIDKAGGLIEELKQYGLPLILIHTLFLIVLFDLLRRLFRNVGRGESFTPQNVRLVQIVGGSLIVFAIVSSVAEGWYFHAIFAYLAQHSAITVSGTQVHLPQLGSHYWPLGRIFPFASTAFWSGLLVLALAEVFRQGLMLKRDNDLTV